jgi:hypothetical protein
MGPPYQGGYGKPVINSEKLRHENPDITSQADTDPGKNKEEDGNGFDIRTTIIVSHDQVSR